MKTRLTDPQSGPTHTHHPWPPDFLNRIWNFFTNPSHHIQGTDQRRHARLLTVLLLCTIFIALWMLVGITRLRLLGYDEPYLLDSLITTLFVLGLYSLSRTRHVKLTAQITVIGITLLSFFQTYPSTQPGDVYWFVYMIIPVLISSLFLSLAATLALIGVVALAMGFYPIYVAGANLNDIPLYFFISVSTLIMVSTLHRNRVEADRQLDLREKEERYRTLLETTFEAILLCQNQGVLEANSGFYDMFGYEPDEIIDQQVSTFLSGDLSFLKQSNSDESYIRELTGLKKDGERFYVEVVTRHLPRQQQMVRVIAIRDITERKVAEQQLDDYRANLEALVKERTVELESAYQQLVEISQMKDEFVANVSHEIRTPLTSLKLRQELLSVQPDKLGQHLDVMKREIKRLEYTIEDLLYLSRLDQGRVEPELQAIDLNTLICNLVEDRRPLAAERQLTLCFNGQDNIPTIQADPRLLSHLVGVLLTNALNYTPAGGTITIQLKQQTKWVGFSVLDTGPGIPTEDINRLFERFYRGKVGHQSGAPGTGLGLSIAQEIATRHQGWIDVQNRREGGASFTVWLPENITVVPEQSCE